MDNKQVANRKWKKFILPITLIIVVLGVLTVIGISLLNRVIPPSGLFGEPEDSVIGEKVSPDGKFVATLFERGAGATTPTAYIITLHMQETAFNPDQGIVFVADETPDIHLTWLGSKELQISVTGGRIFRSERTWNSVAIQYQMKNTKIYTERS